MSLTAASLLESALALVRGAEPRCGATVVVAIDGPSGSGKSTLAHSLSVALAGAPVIRMDDLYAGWDGLAQGVTNLHDQVLEPLARDGQAAYRRFDWHQGRFASVRKLPTCPLLIVEGAGSTVRPCSDLESVRIWLDADPASRRARGIARDGDAYGPHWQRWADQERTVLGADDPRSRAHLVADTTAYGYRPTSTH